MYKPANRPIASALGATFAAALMLVAALAPEGIAPTAETPAKAARA